MTILVTGTAGFIGFKLAQRLLSEGKKVVGVDSHNDYYDVKLKDARVKILETKKNYIHYRKNITNKIEIEKIFEKIKPNFVVNLAAQAGVRYSIENPLSYIDNNLVGFANILESCRHNNVKHLVYASSSSVYGANTKMPFSVKDNVDHPISLYAATKKANELMAHTYSYLYKLPTTGLRFFTVYGPWDRPDMALQKFAHSIVNNKTINIFNNGKHKRDFTYIDDIVECLIRIIDVPALPNLNWSSQKPDPSSSSAPWRLYNIGNNNSVSLMDYINTLENYLGKEAKKNFLPLQPGDVESTFADVDDLIKEFNYKPKVKIEEGIKSFAEWFMDYYNYK
tara:strand:+ start:3042 stop:4052 length:1011 start_codon:yes stop_codon:yes gene_type:complete